METSKSTVEITLSRANTHMAEIVAKALNLSKEAVISFCLKGSTNPKQLH